MTMDWSEVDGILFDVDGTLYSQKRLRIHMLWRLILYYFCRPHRFREALSLRKFRKMREMPEWKSASTSVICREIGKCLDLPEDRIKGTVEYWMFRNPLDLLKKYAYRDVIDTSNRLHSEGKRIFIYSDYPAAEKLSAMGVEYDRAFFFGQPEIPEQKPSVKAMEYIISQMECRPEYMIYVGDRDEKDRVSARMVSIRYYDIEQFRKLLE